MLSMCYYAGGVHEKSAQAHILTLNKKTPQFLHYPMKHVDSLLGQRKTEQHVQSCSFLKRMHCRDCHGKK